MKVFLIRHAETVDNVAGVYAGVRDSKLTVHGTEQAARLGQYLASTSIQLTHIFSSPLTRTIKTAEAIQTAQTSVAVSESGDVAEIPEIVKVQELIEQDFGYYEGKPFRARIEAGKTGRDTDAHRRRHDAAFVDVESRESMGKRADKFLDQHLLPLFDEDRAEKELRIAIVSHGMLLSHLWRRLLLRLPRKSLVIAPEVTAARDNIVLEHLGGWSNTGYLSLSFRQAQPASPTSPSRPAAHVSNSDSAPAQSPSRPTSLPSSTDDASSLGSPTGTQKFAVPPVEASSMLQNWSTTVLAIDSRLHLASLKRQRGGIGRIAHDEGQKKLDGFFTKRPKFS